MNDAIKEPGACAACVVHEDPTLTNCPVSAHAQCGADPSNPDQCGQAHPDSVNGMLLTAYSCLRIRCGDDSAAGAAQSWCIVTTAAAYAVLDHIRLGHPGAWLHGLLAHM
jgi:hypothetical protein